MSVDRIVREKERREISGVARTTAWELERRGVPFDPWAGADLHMELAVRKALHPAERPPMSWHVLKPHERELLGGLAYCILQLHGPLSDTYGRYGRLALVRNRLIEALHATHRPAGEVRGDQGDDLRPFFEANDETREQWRRLQLVVQREFTGSDLDALLCTLAEAGTLEDTLVARRDAIVAQLARLRAGRRVAGKDAA